MLEQASHTVQMIDIDADNISKEDFIKILSDNRPDLVGITATTPTVTKAIEISKDIKNNSSAYTMIGGVHPTLKYREVVSNETIDFVIKGEGERTVVELASCIEEGGDLSKVKGLIYKKDGSIVVNAERELIVDLDSIPFPAIHLFRNQNYTYPDSFLHPTFPIVTSRGCPGKCTFCNTKNLHGRQFRYRSAKDIVDEIEFLVNNYGAREVHIWDDNFTTSKRRVYEIRDEIIKRKVRVLIAIPNGLRVDYVNLEVLTALKEMGVYAIAFGVESGSQRILDNVKKQTTLKRVREAFELSRKVGFEIWAFFILGLPGDDESTILDTISFAKSLDPDIEKFHILKPFPGSAVYEEFVGQNLITDTDYEHYGIHTRPVHRLDSLSEDDLMEWQKKAYRMFYFRPSKIISQITRLKSWNRIKLNVSAGLSILKKVAF